MISETIGENYNRGDTYPLYLGVDSIEQKTLKPAVEGDCSEPFAGGGECNMLFISDTMNYIEEQKYSASLEMGIVGILNTNRELGAEFYKSITSLSSSFLVSTKAVAGNVLAADYDFKPNCSPVEAGSMEGYKRVYGDSFVSSYSYGGMYYLLITVTYSSFKEKSKLNAKFGGGGVIKMFSFDSEVAAELKDELKQTKAEIQFHVQVFGRDKRELPKTLPGLIDYGLDFLNKDFTSPVITDIGLSGYEVVAENDCFNKVASNRKKLLGSSVDDPQRKQGFLMHRAKLHRVRHEIRFIQRAYLRYGQEPDAELKEVDDLIGKDLEKISDIVDLFHKDPEAELELFSAEELRSGELLILKGLKKGMPSIPVREYHSSPQYGGNGGTALDDLGDSSEAVKEWRHFLPVVKVVELSQANARLDSILTIETSSTEVVNQIKVEYETETATADPDYFKMGSVIAEHGSVGNTRLRHAFRKGEYLARIEVRSGVLVDHIKFITTGNSSFESGGDGGKVRTLTLIADKDRQQEQKFLVGIYSRVGCHLDGIMFHYFQLPEKVEWQSFRVN